MSDPRFPPRAFERLDESPDARFYAMPRFVVHLDAAALAAVTEVYRDHLPAGGAVLDLMSGWVSHLPGEVGYARVAGLGMNAEELARNPRLTEWRVQDLNADPLLPWPAGSFDACTICVSIDYLVRPLEVLVEVGRVLRPGGCVVITFSDRCFPTKAVRIWHGLDDDGRRLLVRKYLEHAGCYARIEDLSPGRPPGGGDPLYVLVGRR